MLTAVLVGVAVLATASRLSLFEIGVRAIPAFDDECKIALQARQIADGARPLLILASPYIFPLDAYLMAPFIRALPRDAFGVRIMAFAFGLLTVVLSLAILRRWGPLRDTWPGVLLVLFPSAYMLTLQVGCALPGYPTVMLLATLAAWLAQRHADATRPPWGPALLAGVAGGLAASDTMLALPITAAAGAAVCPARTWRTALASTPLFGLGVLIGLCPHLLATHLNTGAFQAVQQSIGWPEALRKALDPMANRTLPAAFGWGAPIFPDHKVRLPHAGWADTWIGAAIVAILLAVALAETWAFFVRWRRERWPRVDLGLALVAAAWMSLALFAFSARSHSHTYRYLILVVWAFPFILARAYRAAARPAVRGAIAAFAVLAAASNLLQSRALMARWAEPGFADFLKLYDLGPAIRYLDERGIDRAHATYADAYRITHGTDGRIVCSQPYNERFPGWPVPFKEQVDAATNVAYVLSDTYRFPPADFEANLAAMQVSCRRQACGRYEVFTDFASLRPPAGPEIPSPSLLFTASRLPETAAALGDGDPLTRWRSFTNQHAGLWVEVRLPSPRPLSQVAVHYTQYRGDRARGMSLAAWAGGAWTNVAEGISRKIDDFEMINGHPVYGTDRQTIRFPAVLTDRLRLEITEPEPNRDWTIGEIRVFEAR